MSKYIMCCFLKSPVDGYKFQITNKYFSCPLCVIVVSKIPIKWLCFEGTASWQVIGTQPCSPHSCMKGPQTQQQGSTPGTTLSLLTLSWGNSGSSCSRKTVNFNSESVTGVRKPARWQVLISELSFSLTPPLLLHLNHLVDTSNHFLIYKIAVIV